MGENESMNILILASEYPYEKDTNADRTKVVGYFAKEWVKQGHRVIAIVDSSTFPAAFYAVGDKVKGLVSKTFDVSRTPDRLWTKRFAYDEFGVHVENIPITKYVPHGKFSKEALDKQLKEIVTVLENNRFVPDVVTGHWVNPQIMLVPRIAKRYDAKSAFVFHADYGKENCEKFGVQKYIDQIDHIGFAKELIEKNELQNKVHLRGAVDRSEVALSLRKADCFILLSNSETFGVAYIEALASGIPVIATRCGGPEEFMEEQYGLLIDKGSIEQAEDAMLYMCKNIRDYNGIAISDQIRKRFSPETIAKQLMAVYEEIV